MCVCVCCYRGREGRVRRHVVCSSRPIAKGQWTSSPLPLHTQPHILACIASKFISFFEQQRAHEQSVCPVFCVRVYRPMCPRVRFCFSHVRTQQPALLANANAGLENVPSDDGRFPACKRCCLSYYFGVPASVSECCVFRTLPRRPSCAFARLHAACVQGCTHQRSLAISSQAYDGSIIILSIVSQIG